MCWLALHLQQQHCLDGDALLSSSSAKFAGAAVTASASIDSDSIIAVCLSLLILPSCSWLSRLQADTDALFEIMTDIILEEFCQWVSSFIDDDDPIIITATIDIGTHITTRSSYNNIVS